MTSSQETDLLSAATVYLLFQAEERLKAVLAHEPWKFFLVISERRRRMPSIFHEWTSPSNEFRLSGRPPWGELGQYNRCGSSVPQTSFRTPSKIFWRARPKETQEESSANPS